MQPETQSAHDTEREVRSEVGDSGFYADRASSVLWICPSPGMILRRLLAFLDRSLHRKDLM